MAKHGIFVLEEPTSLTPPVTAESGLPVYIGYAPVHMGDPEAVNKPVLCYSYQEAVTNLGYSTDWRNWTLCMAMKTHYSLFGVAPAVFINVYDPEDSIGDTKTEELLIQNRRALVGGGEILPDTVVISDEQGQPYTNGLDYSLEINESGEMYVKVLEAGSIGDDVLKLFAQYKVADTGSFSAEGIIGGIDVSSGARRGIEIIDEVFPRTRLAPGTFNAPFYGQYSGVAAALTAKAESLNSCFKCVAVCSAPPDLPYSEIPAWKEKYNYSSTHTILTYPYVKLEDNIYDLSTQLAASMVRIDAGVGDIPYRSPSNQSLEMDGMCDSYGNEIILDKGQADYLGEQGIVTALNWIGGWRAWGNRTCNYPFSSDPKDAFIPIRRMFNWIANTLILTFWSKIDLPINPYQVEDIVTSANDWLAGLSRRALLGGHVEFRKDDNPNTSLLDGQLTFRVLIAPPPPAQEITFIQEYDVSALDVLFS